MCMSNWFPFRRKARKDIVCYKVLRVQNTRHDRCHDGSKNGEATKSIKQKKIVVVVILSHAIPHQKPQVPSILHGLNGNPQGLQPSAEQQKHNKRWNDLNHNRRDHHYFWKFIRKSQE